MPGPPFLPPLQPVNSLEDLFEGNRAWEVSFPKLLVERNIKVKKYLENLFKSKHDRPVAKDYMLSVSFFSLVLLLSALL